MTKENWIKWLQVRIPILKEKHNEFWLGQALDGYKDDEQSRQAAVTPALPPIEIEEHCIETDPQGNCEETEWIASWSAFPGMVVSAQTREKAIDELMTSIRVQLIHDLSVRGGNAG